MRFLGVNGRFGNQLLQYAFVRLYALEHGLSAEFPDWIGRDLFDLDDPFPSVQLPRVDEKDVDLFGSLQKRNGQVFADKDINGYFCGNTTQWGPRAEEFRAHFTPGRNVRGLLDQAMDRLRAAGKTIVAVHLRRGDFGYGRFWIAPPAWYMPWLRAIWPDLEKPVLYVASDTAEATNDFAEFSPWDARHLGVEIPGADFLIDHHILRHADHLAISNSTFSFTAAMLNERGRSFLRPDPNLRELVRFDPWGAEVLWDPAVDTDAIAKPERVLILEQLRPTDSVVYLGSYCSPLTNFARSVHPEVRIVEAEADASLDCIRRERGLQHVRLLILEDAKDTFAFLKGARQTSDEECLEIVLLRWESGHDLSAVSTALFEFGFALFRLHERSLEQIMPKEPSGAGSYLAVRRGFAPPFPEIGRTGS